MADTEHDREGDKERTVIVTTDGEGRGIGAILLVVALVVILFAVLFFGGVFDRGQPQLNVDVNTPDVNVIVPPSQVPVTPTPQAQVPPVNVDVTTTPAENLSNTETSVGNSG